MGYAALGLEAFGLVKSTDHYHTWRLAFRHPATAADPHHFDAGQPISSFALLSCPDQDRRTTQSTAHSLCWHVERNGILSLVVGPYLISANFGKPSALCPAGVTLSPFPGQSP